MKYKVGDKVRIVSKWAEGAAVNRQGLMDKWLGKTMTIRRAFGDTLYYMEEDYNENGMGWCWSEREIEGLACNSKIVITTDGTETLARLYEGDKVVKSATAKCSPADEFDFNTGARLAFDRLTGEENTSKKWRVVNRPARKGDYIRIVRKSFGFNRVGDILKVSELCGTGVYVKGSDHPRDTGDDNFKWCYCNFHFEVVEPCTAEKKEEYYNGKSGMCESRRNLCIHSRQDL